MNFNPLQLADRVDNRLLDIPWYNCTPRDGEGYLPDHYGLRPGWAKTTGHSR